MAISSSKIIETNIRKSFTQRRKGSAKKELLRLGASFAPLREVFPNNSYVCHPQKQAI
jgi:hypothetical protein